MQAELEEKYYFNSSFGFLINIHNIIEKNFIEEANGLIKLWIFASKSINFSS